MRHTHSRSSHRHFQKTYPLHNLCMMDFRLVVRTQVLSKQQLLSQIGLADTCPVGNLRILFGMSGPGMYRLNIYHNRCSLEHCSWFQQHNMCKQNRLNLSMSPCHRSNRLPYLYMVQRFQLHN
jgi:hypothetical protein